MTLEQQSDDITEITFRSGRLFYNDLDKTRSNYYKTTKEILVNRMITASAHTNQLATAAQEKARQIYTLIYKRNDAYAKKSLSLQMMGLGRLYDKISSVETKDPYGG